MLKTAFKKFEVGRPYHFKFFKGCLPQILLGPFLNTLTHMVVFVICREFVSCTLSTLLKATCGNMSGLTLDCKVAYSSPTRILLALSMLIMLIIHQTIKKQPPEVFYKKVVLKNFAKYAGKHLCQSLFFNKKRLWHRCFPVYFAKFLRTSFSQKTSGRLLLIIVTNTRIKTS